MEECPRYFQTYEAAISLRMAFWLEMEDVSLILAYITNPNGKHIEMDVKLPITNSPWGWLSLR